MDMAVLRDQRTAQNCGSNGHCQIVVPTDIAKLWYQRTLPSCSNNGQCPVAGPRDNAKLRDQWTLSCGTNTQCQVAGPTDNQLREQWTSANCGTDNCLHPDNVLPWQRFRTFSAKYFCKWPKHRALPTWLKLPYLLG